MPKIKTNRTARKKLFPNKNGKVKPAHAFHSHRASSKSGQRNRRLNKMTQVDETNLSAVRRMLPYA